MKLRNLLFAGLAVCTFAACSNDDEPGKVDNTPASLSINVASAISGKAYGNTQTTAEATMKNTVIKVSGPGFSKEYDPANYEKTGTITIPKGEGLIVGGEYTITADVKGAQTAYPSVTLAEETVNNGFSMYGTTKTSALVANANTATVAVDRTVARVDFDALTLTYEGASEGAVKVAGFAIESIKLTGVVESAHAQTGLGTAIGSGTIEGSVTGRVLAGKTKNDLGQFYVYPNSEKTTYLVITGKLIYTDQTELPTTYTTAIDGTTGIPAQLAPISRNTIYKIAANITGDGSGIEGTDLTLTITCNDWSTVALTPDLN